PRAGPGGADRTGTADRAGAAADPARDRVPAGSPRPGRPRRRRGGRRRWTGAATGPRRGPGGADQPGEAARRRCDPRPDRLRLASPGRAHPGRAHPGPTPGVVPLGLAGHREHEGEVAICAPRLGASRTLLARGTTPGAPGPRCGVTCGGRLGASRGIPGGARPRLAARAARTRCTTRTSQKASTSGPTMITATVTESSASIPAMIRAQIPYRTTAHDTRSASAACWRAKADRRMLTRETSSGKTGPGIATPREPS